MIFLVFPAKEYSDFAVHYSFSVLIANILKLNRKLQAWQCRGDLQDLKAFFDGLPHRIWTLSLTKILIFIEFCVNDFKFYEANWCNMAVKAFFDYLEILRFQKANHVEDSLNFFIKIHVFMLFHLNLFDFELKSFSFQILKLLNS